MFVAYLDVVSSGEHVAQTCLSEDQQFVLHIPNTSVLRCLDVASGFRSNMSNTESKCQVISAIEQARTLLGAPGRTTSNKKLLGASALLLVTSYEFN